MYDEGDRNPINNQRLKLISNHNSFRVLFDKIAYVYFIRKKYFYLDFSTGNGQPGEPALCQLYRHTFVPYNETCRDGR